MYLSDNSIAALSNTVLGLDLSKTFCIYSANYLPSFGGVEKFTNKIAAELASEGNKIYIVTNNIYGRPAKETERNGVFVYRLPCLPLIKGRLPIPKPCGCFFELTKEIRALPVDYIVINTRFYPHSLLGASHARASHITPVLIDHGSAYLTLGSRVIDTAIRFYEHAITALLKRHGIAYYGVSKSSMKWLETFKIKAKGVISNAIDADEFANLPSNRDYRKECGLGQNAFLVAFSGRLVPEKGVEAILHAASKLEEQGVYFLLAGEGPLKEKINQDKPNNFFLLGRLEQNDVSSLMNQSNVFCLPTRSEGFSTSLLEASACYTPSAITNVGGVSELIPSDKFGLVLNDQSPDEIIRAVLFYKNNPTLASEMGINVGRRVREICSWKNSASLLASACEDANRCNALLPEDKSNQ